MQDFERISGHEFGGSHRQKLEEKEAYNPTYTLTETMIESSQSFFSMNTNIFIL